MQSDVSRNLLTVVCAVCDVANAKILEAAHIIPVDESGTDDPRNGLPLCRNHHYAFDESMFKINPLNLAIEVYCENLPFLEAVVATKTGEVPHADALSYRYE
jgi:putative restriction endonuclease